MDANRLGEIMRAVMALSGGMDSTCLLIRLLAEGYTVSCISYDYGQACNRDRVAKIKHRLSPL